MAEPVPIALEEKFRKRLEFYQDMGIDLFYRDRFPQQTAGIAEEITLPKPIQKPQPARPVSATPQPTPKLNVLPRSLEVSLFESTSKIADDSLPKILADIGDCTRCKLHRARNKLVFGDGNPNAALVFVGEGPARDEPPQGM